MAYPLPLLEDAKIHLVFHVSILKQYISQSLCSIPSLPHLTDETGPVIQVLIQWLGLPINDNSKEDVKLLVCQYPNLFTNLEDKVFFDGRANAMISFKLEVDPMMDLQLAANSQWK